MTNEQIVLAVVLACAALVSGVATQIAAIPALKALQLSDYKNGGIRSWFKATAYDYLVRYLALGLISAICMIVFALCFQKFGYYCYVGILIYPLFCGLFVFVNRKAQNKTPVVYTRRMQRLRAFNCVINILLCVGVMALSYFFPPTYVLVAVVAGVIPYVTIAANALITPFENMNNNRYIKRATAILDERKTLIKIGITGSYGKTTLKKMLKDMLEKKYKVCASPSNYNTLMGITRTVNDYLAADDEVLIAEMGARFRGDIKKLCDLVKPNIAVITQIGDQHLESFGSREAVIATKSEIFEGLDSDGYAVTNADNEDCRAIYEKLSVAKSLVGSEKNEVAYYSDVKISGKGTSFTLTLNGEDYKVCSPLLGRHVASAVTLASAVALKLGVSATDIVDSVQSALPVPHRLQPIVNGDVTVLDDAYNSNPRGAANALEVLSEFDAVKIIITPGFVELGAIEERENEKLGEIVGKVCDYAFFVGTRAPSLVKGALKSGMNESAITVCDTLDEAVKAQSKIEGAKAVLFENDLPDNMR